MAKKKIEKVVEKTPEETLNEQKKDAWENFKKLDFDKMSPQEREGITRHLYETMSTYPAPPTIEISYDFWKQYENTDEIKSINQFVTRVDHILANLPNNPIKESWLDREHGILTQMKREWKGKTETFKNERILREQIRQKAEDIFNLPENKGKHISVNMAETIKKAEENIEETCYKPTRAKIEQIETEIRQRVK